MRMILKIKYMCDLRTNLVRIKIATGGVEKNPPTFRPGNRALS